MQRLDEISFEAEPITASGVLPPDTAQIGSGFMKAIATLAFGIASVLGAGMAAASVASIVLAEPETHGLANLSAPDIWTAKPVKVDPSTQTYERIPAALSTYAANPPKIHVALNVAAPSDASANAPVAMTADHQNWCAGQYRSFNPETNSYRSFSGETKTCVSPFDASTQAANAGMPDQTGVQPAANEAIAGWCAARYQSYRAADNTYQPYDGPRRACDGPRPTDQVASRF